MVEKEPTKEPEITASNETKHTPDSEKWDQGMKGFIGGLIIGIVSMGIVWFTVTILFSTLAL